MSSTATRTKRIDQTDYSWKWLPKRKQPADVVVNDLPIDNTQLNLPGIENGVGSTKIDGTLDAWMLVPILMVLLVQNKTRMI